VVSLIMGAPLTIKGPAAGLIVIVAGSVAELGHGNNELGWHLALGAIIVAGAIQVLMGLLKWENTPIYFLCRQYTACWLQLESSLLVSKHIFWLVFRQ